ncbi:hypothetical protein GCM10019016_098560 [Streptomyces prasinosporus]|uniref:Uncharacterized protein n=1 Tax=Streptomyces prasinosporus TaxID=68256 RepID=A0ABP6U500_9ACTN
MGEERRLRSGAQGEFACLPAPRPGPVPRPGGRPDAGPGVRRRRACPTVGFEGADRFGATVVRALVV